MKRKKQKRHRCDPKKMSERKGACNVHTFTPKLTTTDWNAEWMRLQEARRAADSAAHWDERAKNFHRTQNNDPYVDRFVDALELTEGDTVFDMGCGNGAISIPVAREGHRVIAADFSQGMLAALEQEASTFGDLPITTKLMSWSDDWDAHDITPKCVDVACASRSIATADLRESLTKLSSVARKRCVITLTTGTSPRVDESIMEAIGLQSYLGRDFAYAFMILIAMGYMPEVSYIPSHRSDTFESETKAFESLAKMAKDASGDYVSKEELDRALTSLRSWIHQNLIPNPDAGKTDHRGDVQKAYILKKARKVTWALIAWNV